MQEGHGQEGGAEARLDPEPRRRGAITVHNDLEDDSDAGQAPTPTVPQDLDTSESSQAAQARVKSSMSKRRLGVQEEETHLPHSCKFSRLKTGSIMLSIMLYYLPIVA